MWSGYGYACMILFERLMKRKCTAITIQDLGIISAILHRS